MHLSRLGVLKMVADNPSQAPGQRESQTRIWQIVGMVAALLCLISPFIYLQRSEYSVKPVIKGAPSFVGSGQCRPCHQEAYAKWKGSHHDLAMDIASEETVLGDFNNVQFVDPYSGAASRFFRKNGDFYVETEGPGGAVGVFKITHTFGVYPNQQYLIPFPGGRLQCLNVGWNAKQSTWYRLPPYEVDGPDDWLHWTKGGQTWNGMCAECHSTKLEKRYDKTTDTYDTRWFEIHVGCEACHGPGSNHVSWANRTVLARPQVENYDLPVNTATIDNQKQIAICAPCHSRRYQLGDNLHDEGEILDKIVPSLLMEGLYYPDGQISEEVYVYGSFVQSKMYQHGVRCSDCHDMHSLKLHKEGNDLCLQCHRAVSYDTPSHHFHKQIHEGKPSKGYLCVKCHMPGRVYMGVDYRPDHSLRVPRPDLSEKIDVPNSCSTSDCHQDKGLAWVNDQYTKWYGKSRKQHYGEILAAGRKQNPEAIDELIGVAEDSLLPAIVRATALALLSRYPQERTIPVYTSALEDGDALLRHTALRNAIHIDPETRLHLLQAKLYDPVKAVRIEAAAGLSGFPLDAINPQHQERFQQILAEYRTAMEYNSDFAPQRYNLGNLAAAIGKGEEAIQLYREALAIDDQFYQAKVNLAMQLNQQGENLKAADLFKQVLEAQPDLHEIAYSLGLLFAEMEEYEQAAYWLGQAADNMPNHSRARYNQALAYLKLEQWENGEMALLKALENKPGNREYFSTLANLYYNFRLTDKARILAEKTLLTQPDHELAKQLLEALSRQ